METIEIKPTEIICLQTNDSLLDLDFLRKCMNGLFEYKTLCSKMINESNLITDEKTRYEFERIEQRFNDTIRGNETALHRYLQDEWPPDEFSTTLQTFCDSNMDSSDVTQTYIATLPASQVQTVENLNANYANNLGEKKDVMAIAAAEVVMHSYRDGLYICGWPNCEYQTSSRRHINNHKLVHTGDGEFNCGFAECGRRFKTRDELNEHAAMHQSDHPYPCVWPGCDFRSETPASLKAHMRVHMERKFKCEWPDCNEEFLKISELSRHRSIHDQNGNANQSANAASGGCPQQQQQQAQQQNQQNVLIATNQQQQAQAQQQQQQVTVVTQQPQQIAQIITTNAQGQQTGTLQPTQITGQLSTGQQVTLIQLQQPPASNVGTAIAHKTIVAQQTGTNSTVVPSNQPQPITTAIAVAGTNAMINTQLFRCNNPTCNSLFSTLYDLKQHMIQHSKVEKHFGCNFTNCEYSAFTKTQLNEHKITHSNERNYVCTVENCGRRYKTRKGLWDHSHTHRPDKPFACTYPNCTYRCVSSSYLRSHMRGHKDPPPVAASGNVAAATTPVGTTTTQNIQVMAASPLQGTGQAAAMMTNSPQQFFAPGTMIQHSNGTQEYICGVLNCNKSFDSQNNYLAHVKMHAPMAAPAQIGHTIAAAVMPAPAPAPPPLPSPVKTRSRNPELARFKCEFEGCNAAYKLKRNLKDHMIRHTILEKPYRCDWPGCDYGSYKSTNVAKHKSVHSDERKYACDFYNCEKKFKTREGLRKHMLSHHKPPAVVVNNNAITTNNNNISVSSSANTTPTTNANVANNNSNNSNANTPIKAELSGNVVVVNTSNASTS